MASRILQKLKGGRLRLRVVDEAPYVPAASPTPTCTLLNADGSSQLGAAATATRGPQTTIGAAGVAAGVKASIPVASQTGLELGKQHVLGPAAATGKWEIGVIDAINADGTIDVRDDLENDYASGDAFASPELYIDIADTSDAVANTLRDGHAKWSFTINSQARTQTDLFTVSVWSLRMPVTDKDVMGKDATAVQALGTRQLLRERIETEWSEMLEELALAIDPGAVVSSGPAKYALIYRVLASIERGNEDEEARANRKAQADNAYDRLLASAIDTNANDSIDADDKAGKLPANCGRMFRGG